MKLPEEMAHAMAAAMVSAGGRMIAERLEASLADLQLFTMQEVAARLRVSVPTARRLVGEVVILGESSPRVSAATLRKLIEARTVGA